MASGPEPTRKSAYNLQRMLFGLVLAFAVLAGLGSLRPWAVDSIPWTSNLDQALAEAKKEHKPVFIDFYADWCQPCRDLERHTYTDQKVKELVSSAIPVKINIDKQPAIANRFNIPALPYMAVLDSSGKVLKDNSGYLDPSTFAIFWHAPNNGASPNGGLVGP